MSNLTALYNSIDQDGEIDSDLDRLIIQMKRLELEYEKRKAEYQERKRECEENSNRGNRIEANEALFTIESKLEGIEEANEFLQCLHDVHKKSGTNQDRGMEHQVGDWLEEATKDMKKRYAEFRDKYISAVG